MQRWRWLGLDVKTLLDSSNLNDGHGGDELGLEWMISEFHPTQMIPNTAGGPGGTTEHMDGMVMEFPCTFQQKLRRHAPSSGLEMGIRQQSTASNLLISAQQQAKPSYFFLKKTKQNNKNNKKKTAINAKRILLKKYIRLDPIINY